MAKPLTDAIRKANPIMSKSVVARLKAQGVDMTDKEQQIAEMAELVESIGCTPDVTVLEALYDAHYRKVDVEKLTRLPDKIIQEIVEKSNKEASDYANVTEGNFEQEDIKVIFDNIPWLVAQAQLAYTKQELK